MSKMKAYLAMAMAMSMMAGQMPLVEREGQKGKRVRRPQSGTKEYFFNMHGEYSTDHMLRSECVFSCYAINDKNAVKKFNKFQKQSYDNK